MSVKDVKAYGVKCRTEEKAAQQRKKEMLFVREIEALAKQLVGQSKRNKNQKT